MENVKENQNAKYCCTKIYEGDNKELVCVKIYKGDWGDWDEPKQKTQDNPDYQENEDSGQ